MKISVKLSKERPKRRRKTVTVRHPVRVLNRALKLINITPVDSGFISRSDQPSINIKTGSPRFFSYEFHEEVKIL